MKIVTKNNYKQLLPIAEYGSGTVVKYGSKTEEYGYGIIMKNEDSEWLDKYECIIYDIEDKNYYTDYKNYYVYEVYENAELVLNE